MADTITLTLEELQQAQQFQNAATNLTFQIGEIAVRQQAAIRQLNQIREAQANFNNEIAAKYGDIAFDINTGEAIQPQSIFPTSTEETATSTEEAAQ